MNIESRIFRATNIPRPRNYYDDEEQAYAAARDMSRTSACGLFVDSDSNGFFVTPLGRFGSSCYFGGELLSDIEED